MRARLLVTGIAAVWWLGQPALTYWYNGPKWTGNPVMQLQLGSSSGSLIDGSSSWNVVAENALGIWNSYISTVSFRVVRDSTVANASGNDINNVVWGDNVYGDAFGAETLAVAVWWYRGSAFTEADVVFNTRYSWNSYRGSRRSASGGGTLHDLRRVAIHEFGHALGLDHPDEHSQSVSAIMNSRSSDIDTVQSDDIAGARFLYGTATSSNRSPSVTASCNPCRVQTGRATTISASGSDPDGDSLTYRWTASAGTIASASATSTTYTAPGQSGNVTVTATVSDGRGGSASSSVTIEVVPSDRLQGNERLSSGQFLMSTNRRYRLLYQSDGNLVLYDDVGGGAAWASNTGGTSAGYLLMQLDGNLVVYDGQIRAVWTTNTPGNSNSRLVLQDDGNLVLYSASNQPLWHRLQ